MQNKKQVIVQVEVTAAKPIKDLYWFMQTRSAIQISADKRSIVLILGDEKLKPEIVIPQKAGFEVLGAKPLPASAQPANKGVRRLAIHLKNVGQTTIAVVFKEVGDKSATTVKPLKTLVTEII